MATRSELPVPAAGNIAVPQDREIEVTPHPQIDAAVADVAAQRSAWGALGVASRIELLDRLIADTVTVARRWAEAECDRKGIPRESPTSGEEWAVGPWCTLSYMRHLRATLQEIERHGRPRLPGPIRSVGDGRVSARIFPRDPYDRVQYMGLTGEVWMPPGVGADEVRATIGGVYRADGPRASRLGAILGAGNISSIPVLDVIHKMFVENQVVVLKLNPITDHLGPVFDEALRALIGGGYLRIVHGGADEAHHLLYHDAVDVVHMTGSDKTHDAIVFGTGADAAALKAGNRPLLDKPITSELGNVTPVIVVPGDWSRSDFDFQARMIAATLAHGGSYECITPRVLVTHAGWGGREQLLSALRRALREVANRVAFYPGARDRFSLFTDAHPEAELLGAGPPGSLPWALIAGVAPDAHDLVFTTDPFSPVLAETALEAASPAEFIDRAVGFCNEHVWGTLAAAAIVHPHSLRQSRTAAAFERAVAGLRYGTIAVNGPAFYGFALTSAPWGAFPGHEAGDIRSGHGVVHNSYLLARTEKTVFRGPFHIRPKPAWWPTNGHANEVFARLADLEAAPSPAKMSAIVSHAMRG